MKLGYEIDDLLPLVFAPSRILIFSANRLYSIHNILLRPQPTLDARLLWRSYSRP